MSAVLLEWSEWNYVHCRDYCPNVEYCDLEGSNCTIIRFRTEAMLLESSSPYTQVSNQTDLCPACKGLFAESSQYLTEKFKIIHLKQKLILILSLFNQLFYLGG